MMPLEFTCFDDCPDNNGFGYNSPFSDEYYLPTKKSISMPLLQNKLQAELEEFRTQFPSLKVLVEKDYLIYIFDMFYNAARTCLEANLLIERMGLSLVAIHHGNNSFFTVQSNETE